MASDQSAASDTVRSVDNFNEGINFIRVQKWHYNGFKSNRLGDTAVLLFYLIKQPSFLWTE